MQHVLAQLFLLLHEVAHHNEHIADLHFAIILVPVQKENLTDFYLLR